MKKLYIVTLIALCGLLSNNAVSPQTNNYHPDLKEIEPESLLSDTCEKLSQRTSFFLTKEELHAKEQCIFLNNLLKQTKEKGCSPESLGLGFTQAIEQFYNQNSEDQKFTSEIRYNYLASEPKKGKTLTRQAIGDILPIASQEAKQEEFLKFKVTANRNVKAYVQNFKAKKTKQLAEEKEKEERKKRRF